LGQIVGSYDNSAGTHGFLLSNGVYTTIDGPSANYTVLYGINDSEQIVGQYQNSSGEHGFLATPILQSGTDNGATDLDAGHVVTISLSINETVYVTGNPFLSLNDNELATYTSGSGTNTLTFTYTVQQGDNTPDLQVTGLNLNGGTIQDSAGNALSGLVQGDVGLQIDTVTPNAPTVAVSIDNTDVNVANHTGLVTFTFSEAPVAFTLSDTSAVGGTLSNLQQVNATTYTATFAGAANMDVSNASVSVTFGSWQESDGNAGAGGSTAPFTVDTVTPTVAVSIDNTDVNVAHNTGTVTFTFSEAPTSFTLADTRAVGGTLSNLQQSDATHYTATFTGAANTAISNASVSVTAGSWQGEQRQCRSGRQHAICSVVQQCDTVSILCNGTGRPRRLPRGVGSGPRAARESRGHDSIPL
jgi:ribosomal protein L6P/L9E